MFILILDEFVDGDGKIECNKFMLRNRMELNREENYYCENLNNM